jgi:hypothetical protein
MYPIKSLIQHNMESSKHIYQYFFYTLTSGSRIQKSVEEAASW